MHWFWRAAIAIVLSSIPCLGMVHLFPQAPPGFWFLRTKLGEAGAIWLLISFPASLVSILAFSATARHTHTVDVETRCRRCGYILRGISEPRCPECGERI